MSGKKKRQRVATDRKVSTILEQIKPEFVVEGARKITADDLETLIDRASEIRGLFSKGGALDRYAKDGATLISVIEDYRSGSYRRIPYWSVAVITFSLLYVIKPIDIIPDSLPVIGQLDDAVVVTHCLDIVKKDLESYRLWKLVGKA